MSASANSSTSVDDCEVTLRLLELSKKTDYQIVQENGQRRITAPEMLLKNNNHAKGAEVFIGRLPRDCFEDELLPILDKVGRVLELRMMLDFSGTTRGYAFALFEDAKIARKVCEMLDGQEIRKGHRIGVVKSIDNCRLFFGGVPKDKAKEEFLEELTKMLEGIVDVYLYPSSSDRRLNRGFIFVEFKDHRSAAMARRKLVPGKVMLWNHEVAVDWADPEPGDPVDDAVMETVTALFIRNLSLETTPHQMKEELQKATKTPILKLKKISHFAFVHYETRSAAKNVLNIMNRPGGVAERFQWEVCWAKPIGTIKSSERQRCINDAISKAQGKNNVSEKQQGRINTRSKSRKNASEVSNRDLSYFDVLRDLVMKMWHANCVFDVYQSPKSLGYFCKICIFKENYPIFECCGNEMSSEREALDSLNEIALSTYQILYSQLNTYSLTTNSSGITSTSLGNVANIY